MRYGLLLLVVAAGLGALSPAQAQDYPTRTIRIIVTTSAGGVSDVFVRTLAEPLRERLGQPVIVENRPGGFMILGARACAEAAPDGHTLCVMPGEPLTYNQFQFKSIPYDPEKSFEPITNFFFITQTLAVSAKLNVKNLEELAALSKAKAGTLSYSSPTSSLVMFMEKFKADTGADLVKVPFKGGGDTVNGILSGVTPVGLLGLGNMIEHLRAGTIVPLLVDGAQRSPLFPDVPTLTETRLSRRAHARLLRPARASRHAEGHRGAAARHHHVDRARSGVRPAASHRARARAGAQHAGGVRGLLAVRSPQGRAHPAGVRN